MDTSTAESSSSEPKPSTSTHINDCETAISETFAQNSRIINLNLESFPPSTYEESSDEVFIHQIYT
jgi:hypothetical protein